MKKFAFLLIIPVFLLIAGCSGFGDFEIVEDNGSSLKAIYTAQNNGAANITVFMLKKIFDLGVKYPEATTLNVEIIVMRKDGSEMNVGVYEFDDFAKSRQYESKNDYVKHCQRETRELKKLINTAIERDRD